MLGHLHQTNGVSHFLSKIAIMLTAAMLLSGCATTDQAWDTVQSAWRSMDRAFGMVSGDTGELEYPDFKDRGLKTVIAVGAVGSLPKFAGKGLDRIFQEALVGAMGKKCGDVIVLQPDQPEYPQQLMEQKKSLMAGADSFPMCTFAGEKGINAVLVGGMTDFRRHEDEKGLLWFRDTHYYLQILATTIVYDTETGAKLLDRNHQYEMEVDLTTYDLFESNPKDLLPMVMEGIQHTSQEIGEMVCEAMERAPWATRILEVKEGRLVLAAGSATGLAPGRELDVLETTTIVPGPDGRQYVKPGHKIGTIRVSNVSSAGAEAEIVDGSGFKAGDTARVPQ